MRGQPQAREETSLGKQDAELGVRARSEVMGSRPWKLQRRHVRRGDGADRNGQRTERTGVVEDLEWEGKGQRGGLQGRVNRKERFPPRHIPPNHTKPTPRRTAVNQVKNWRTCEAARRNRITSERELVFTAVPRGDKGPSLLLTHGGAKDLAKVRLNTLFSKRW